MFGGQLLDNRVNCQLGVLNVTRDMLRLLASEISRFSNVDEVNPLLVEASKQLAYRPDHWMMPASESVLTDALDLVKEYNRRVLAGDSNAKINVTTQDITTILDGIIDALGEPRGRVTGTGHVIPYNELDDRVYYAACASIVARDVFSALWVGFREEMEKGAEENAEKAIYSLSRAARFNPWWVARGDGDAMVADHRSKVARYMTDAVEMIKVVRNSIKN